MKPYYQDGSVELYHGDCIEFMATMPKSGVHLTLTDIPYDGVNRGSSGLRTLHKGIADVATFTTDSFVNKVCRVTSGSIYIFCGQDQFSGILMQMKIRGLSTRGLVWEKTNPSPMNGQYIWLSGIEMCVFGKKDGATFNEHCANSVLRYQSGSSKLHPTQKPMDMMERLVSASSSPGELVFDPCAGSGTTLIAAKKLGRRAIGCELDEANCEIIAQRLGQNYLELDFS